MAVETGNFPTARTKIGDTSSANLGQGRYLYLQAPKGDCCA